MDKRKRKRILPRLHLSMAASFIGAIALLLLLFGVVVSILGFLNFTNAFKKEYATTTYHMADTATTFLNGDHLEAYLAGEEMEEYREMEAALDTYCHRICVSLIYVILVDRSDYGRFVSVVNPVDNSVDNSEYKVWELGYRRNTTNDEYRRKYKAIYEQEVPYETVYRIRTTDGQHPHITTLVPVKNSAGEVAAILCMQRPVRELREARRPYLLTIALSTVMLGLVASALAALVIRSQFVAPIQRVSQEATRFARENTKGETLGEISRYPEISNLSRSIDTMEADMVSYMENLTAATAEKERIGAELSLASTIQLNSIPNVFPAFPDRQEFDIFASMTPAKDVGGDFYNFFPVDEDHLALVIGDVSGKGIPAALFMMVTNILISDRTTMGGSPAEILSFVNDNICPRNQAEMFVTVWLGILEISTGRLTAANAGHEYPALKRPDGSFALLKDKHSFVVGGMEGVKYREYELQLEPGTKLFLYTDGVPEATDAGNAMFGAQRMLAALDRASEGTPEELLRSVRGSVDEFVGDAEQFDDLTMLCLHYRGPAARELRTEALIENIPAITEFVERELEKLDCPPKARIQLDIAIDELVSNVAKYAYSPETGPVTVRVEVEKEPTAVILSFIDGGRPYDPLAAGDPDVTASAEERGVGGLGVYMVKRSMDDVSYEYKDGQNILRIRKNL